MVILSSEAYNTKKACDNGIESVRKNCKANSKFDRTKAKNGKYKFNLKAANGQVIGTSQMYASNSNMEKGIASVKKNAPKAKVIGNL